MIDDDVSAALCAIAAIAHFAALEFPEELCPFGDFHIVDLPQRECADRGGGIAPAGFAMAITHLQRFAAKRDLHRSAVTTAWIFFSHGKNITGRTDE